MKKYRGGNMQKRTGVPGYAGEMNSFLIEVRRERARQRKLENEEELA